MDLIEQILEISVFLTPLLTIPLFWRFKNLKKGYRILFGLVSAGLLSLLFWYLAILILFRNGIRLV